MWTIEWHSGLNGEWLREKSLETLEEAMLVLVLKKFKFPEWQWRLLDPNENEVT